MPKKVKYMSEQKETPEWLVYQRCVAAFAHERYGNLDVTVQPNVFIVGNISGVKRQIDVLVDARWEDDTSKRIIIDAKYRKDKIDINDVETIIGMMQDCRADRAVLVCTSGDTQAAFSRAQDAINISILTLEEALKYEWVYEPCLGKYASRKSNRTGMVLWGEYMVYGGADGLWTVIQTGKCDVCHSFHVWCWECGEKFAVPDDQTVTCTCNRPWTSAPDDINSTWLITYDDQLAVPPVVLDRKPLK